MLMATSACPLCGQRNHCAQAAAATPVHDCWCFSTPITADALERLPAEQRNRACLCPRCTQGLPPDADAPAKRSG